MSLQSQEPQLQSVVRNGALATGQRLFPTLKLYVADSEAEQLSGIILCSNRWLCQDSRVNLLEVLEWPTTNVDLWTAFLRGKDGWLQPLKLYATYSGVKQLSGKTRTMWNRSALVEVLCGYHSQPLCSELLWFIQFSSSESTAKFIGIPSNLFPNVNISIQHNSRM